MKRARPKATVLCAIALSIFSCTWVSVSEEGRNVRVLQANAATGCKKIGNVSATTTDRITIFARSDQKVQRELESLARNEATELGGNAIVPIDSVKDGRQSFDVYRCQPQ